MFHHNHENRIAKLTVLAWGLAIMLAWGPAALSAPTQPPRVLLIGDSICGGYAPTVRAALKDQAVVIICPGNAGPTSLALAKPKARPPRKNPPTDAAGNVPDPTDHDTNLDHYLAHGPFDVIHFNWGLHDLKHGGIPIDQYIANLSKLVERLEQTGAKLIFATTTPVPPKNAAGRVPETVVAFNQAATALMRERNIAINDLHAAVLPQLDQLQIKDNVHFGGKGYRVLGLEVARHILTAIDPEARLPLAEPAADTPASPPAADAPDQAPAPNDASREVAKLVAVNVEPAFDFAFDRLNLGTLQHIDRRYRYVSVPEALRDGFVFQGIHRVPADTTFTLTVHAPTTIWLAFLPRLDGGWGRSLGEDWTKLDLTLSYQNPNKKMIIYRMDAQPGQVVLPRTTADRVCMALVFKPAE